MFFSIIIPLYNKEKHISKTVQSVLNQTYADYEIIIVNDGSTDASLTLANAFKDQRVKIYSIQNKGVSYARNYAVTKCNYTHIAFLDADDLWKPNHLQQLKHLIQTYPDCGLYAMGYEKSFFERKKVKANFSNLKLPFVGIVTNYFDNSYYDALCWTSAIAMTKKQFNHFGGFDEDLRSGQDTEFWVRIALQCPIAFSSKITAIKRLNCISNHLSFSVQTNDRVKVLNRFLKYEKNNQSLKKYMDLNRFSVAIDQKIKKNYTVFSEIKKDITLTNLNRKQKILLHCSSFILIVLKKMQLVLLKNKLYLTVFKT